MMKTKGNNTWMIKELYVDQDARGQGWGTFLFKHAVKWADKEGANLWLYASSYDEGPSMEELVKFYKKFGFKAVQNGEYEFQMARQWR